MFSNLLCPIYFAIVYSFLELRLSVCFTYPCEDDIKGNPIGNARDKAVLDLSNDVRLILDIDLFLAPKATFAKMSYGLELRIG